jgi:hypothetical protein
MEAEISSDGDLNFYQVAQCYFSADRNIQSLLGSPQIPHGELFIFSTLLHYEPMFMYILLIFK